MYIETNKGSARREKPIKSRFFLFLLLAWPSGSAAAEPITLDEAVRIALERSPTLAVEQAAVAEAEARLRGAEVWQQNPEVGADAAARLGPDDTSADWSVSVGQAFPLGGQRGKRMAASRAEVVQAQATLEAARIEVLLRVHRAFLDVLLAKEELVVEQAHAELSTALAAAAQRRLEAGATGRLEVDVARIEVGRSAGRVAAARGAVRRASAGLAEVMAADPMSPPEAQGVLAPPAGEVPALAALIEAAQGRRVELRVIDQALITARARLAVAEADAVPDLTVSLTFGREANTETLVGGGLSMPIPLFNSNQGPIAEASAAVTRLEAEKAAIRNQIAQEVAAALSDLQTAFEVEQALRDQVLQPLDDSLDLLRRAFESGKVAGSEVLVLRSEFRESRLEWLAALAASHRARLRLDQVTGHTTVPQEPR